MSIKGYKFRYRPVTDPASDWIKANDTPQADPDFTYTDLSADTQYELEAQAVDNANNESEWSTPLVVTTPAHNPADDPLNAADAAALDSIVTQYKAPAFGALLSVTGPKGTYSKAYGTNYTGGTSPVAGEALTLDHKMRFGSNSKMYTAVLIFRQIDLGHLSLDDTLESFIPGIKYGNVITIYHLLLQTSGVPSYLDMGKGMANGLQLFLHPTSACDPIALIHGVADKDSDFYPGTSYAYSNSNYTLLGRILELLDVQYGTSRDWRTIFQEDLFDPLGLTETEWPTGLYMSPPYSRGYMDNPAWATMVQTVNSLPLAWLLGAIYWAIVPSLSGGWPATPYMEFTAVNSMWGNSSGGFDGTIEDMRKFGECLARGDLLSEESKLLRKEVFTTYAKFTPAQPYQGNGWMGAGLGIMAWGDWRGWIGAFAGYNSCLWYNDKNGAVIAIAVSWYTGPSWDLFMRLAYQLHPDSLGRPDWTMRQASSFIPDDEFGSAALWRWHAIGDEDGDANLPHKVPFYL